MLLAYDQFLNKRVVKPLSKTAQRWLHVNRFHLLAVGYVAFFVTHSLFVVGPIFIAAMSRGGPVEIIGLLVQWYLSVQLVMHMGLAKEFWSAAHRFEAGKHTGLSFPIIYVVIRALILRRYLNVLLTVWIATSHSFLYSVPAIIFLFWIHLVDGENVAPRDREYWFVEQQQAI